MSFKEKIFPWQYLILFIILAFLAFPGCTAAAVAYGVSKMTAPAASKTEPAPTVVRSTELHSYPEYVTEMERINLEREKAGFPPRPIMTPEEWASGQQAGRPPAVAAQAPPAAPPPPESAAQAPAAE